MRIIDADAVIERLNKVCLTDDYLFMALKQGIDHAIAVINEAPTIDAEPVKHGRWLPQIVLGTKAWDCSECKTLGSPHWKRCPICEAKMDGERKET